MKVGLRGGIRLASVAPGIGEIAPKVSKYLWPSLRLVQTGSVIDRHGTDAFMNNKGVQIKGDWTIARTQNIYHEIYEKTKGKEGQKWRHSPANAFYYIFVTGGFAVITTVHALAEIEIGMRMILINPTSIGFLIYLPDLSEKQVKEYDLDIVLGATL